MSTIHNWKIFIYRHHFFQWSLVNKNPSRFSFENITNSPVWVRCSCNSFRNLLFNIILGTGSPFSTQIKKIPIQGFSFFQNMVQIVNKIRLELVVNKTYSKVLPEKSNDDLLPWIGHHLPEQLPFPCQQLSPKYDSVTESSQPLIFLVLILVSVQYNSQIKTYLAAGNCTRVVRVWEPWQLFYSHTIDFSLG